MIRRVASTMDDTQGGVHELIVIEGETKSLVRNQNKEQQAKMRDGTTAECELATGASPQ